MGFPKKQVNFIQNEPHNFNQCGQTYNLVKRQYKKLRWSDNQQGNNSNNAQQEKKMKFGRDVQSVHKNDEQGIPAY